MKSKISTWKTDIYIYTAITGSIEIRRCNFDYISLTVKKRPNRITKEVHKHNQKSTMADDDILFDDVYELYEVIGK